MDSQQLQQATSNPNIQRVLQKQVSLSKRLSTASASQHEAAAAAAMHHIQAAQQLSAPPSTTAAATTQPSRISIPEQSFSHTETAV